MGAKRGVDPTTLAARRARGRTRRSAVLAIAIVLSLVAVALGVPAATEIGGARGATSGADAAPPPPPAPPTGTAAVLAHLIAGREVATTSKSFWSVDLQTAKPNGVVTSPGVRSYLAQTPFTWVRYGGNTEACNVTKNVDYGSNGQPAGGCQFNVTALKQWCAGQTPACHAILDLPAENNNSGEVANIARYIVQTVGFQPTYWSIGNEPSGWTHYGEPWTSWRSGDRSTPTPMAYAFDVKAAITAVRSVDPGAKFIGIEAACPCNTLWFQDVMKIDGANLAALAVHNYPSDLVSGHTAETLAQFYDPLHDAQNVTGAIHAVRSAIAGECARCGTIPIFVNEYNAGPGWDPSNHAGRYANAVFLAASVVQALLANVQQLTIFDLQTGAKAYGYSLLNGAGAVAPTGTLFSNLLSHLAIGHVYRDVVRTTIPGVWSVVTRGGGTESLLVVNTNLGHAIQLSLGTAFPTGAVDTKVSWAPGESAPVIASAHVALSYTVPSQGILLVNTKSLLGAGARAPHPAETPAHAVAAPAPAPSAAGRGPVSDAPRPTGIPVARRAP